MRTNKSYMIVISHFKLYPALFPLKWLICIPNISAVRGNVVFETLHDFYRTAININITMGKDSHFTGQPVYSQVLKLLDKTKIRQIRGHLHNRVD